MTREQWLEDACVKLGEHILERTGREMPKTRVSVGFPKSSRGKGNHAIGQCWSATCVKDGVSQMFISPVLEDVTGPQGVLSVLLHEQIHALVGCEHGHKKPFKDIAVKCGLEGKMTATVASEELQELFKQYAIELGEYPHVKLDPKSKPKKQTTRLLKVVCPECEYTIRVTRKHLDGAGAPFCPCKWDPMSEEGQDLCQMEEGV